MGRLPTVSILEPCRRGQVEVKTSLGSGSVYSIVCVWDRGVESGPVCLHPHRRLSSAWSPHSLSRAEAEDSEGWDLHGVWSVGPRKDLVAFSLRFLTQTHPRSMTRALLPHRPLA